MASKEFILKAHVSQSESLALRSPKSGGNVESKPNFCELTKFDEENVKQSDDLSHELDKDFANSESDELYKNVPELKKTFVIKSKIGEGTFSNVYLGHLVEYPNEIFALKHIIPTSSPDRVEREVRCLQEMGGKNNVIGYKGTIRHCDHSIIILPYVSHEKFQDYLHEMTISDIQDYMRNLMKALKHIHSFSIIHRDIKPGNFLHSTKQGGYNLVDFGLAMHEPNAKNAWDIEKKNGYSTSEKNSRELSPESRKNSQAIKKPRTSPRVSFTSHKLGARQLNGANKSKHSPKQVNQSKHNDAKSRHQAVKFVAPSEKEKKVARKSALAPAIKGLCPSKHKTHEICSVCIRRTNQSAPRAGTSGFRAPEVLLKYPHQTTAVDMWSAGVIMLCLLSGKYPFFRCVDDMTALAQIITLFGKQRVVQNTKHLGKYMVSNCNSPGYELKDLCQKMRFEKRKGNQNNSTQCCSSCNKHRTTTKTDGISTSPASNLRRASLREKSTLKGSSIGVGTCNEGMVEVGTKLWPKKSTKIVEAQSVLGPTTGLSRETSNSQVVEVNCGSLQPEVLVEFNVGEQLGDANMSAQTSIHNDSKSVSDVVASKANVKVRFSSESRPSPSSDRPLSETEVLPSERRQSKSEDNRLFSECNRTVSDKLKDGIENGSFREHLDGSRCACDCGSCPLYVPVSAYELLERCLDLNPFTRITAAEALSHPFLCKGVSLQSER